MSHSPAALAPSSTAARRPARVGPRKLVWGLLIGGAALVVLAATVAIFGHVEGEQFSPTTFHRRTFFYFEVPLVRLQVTPVWRDQASDDLRRRLASKGFVPAGDKSAPWDMVRLSRTLGGEAPPGAAQILCDYLTQVDTDGGQVWLDWTKKKPALADIFWPEIVAAAQQRLYWFAPDLFALAREAEDAEAFKSELKSLLAEKYAAAADIQLKLGRFPEAERLFQEALLRDPSHAAAKQGLAESRQSSAP